MEQGRGAVERFKSPMENIIDTQDTNVLPGITKLQTLSQAVAEPHSAVILATAVSFEPACSAAISAAPTTHSYNGKSMSVGWSGPAGVCDTTAVRNSPGLPAL